MLKCKIIKYTLGKNKMAVEQTEAKIMHKTATIYAPLGM